MPESTRSVAYLFCDNPERDPVAFRIFTAMQKRVPMEHAGFEIDGWPVLQMVDDVGARFLLGRTADVVAHDYPRYLPLLHRAFGDVDLVGLVNWHEGKNAPDRILTVHTTGDVVSGTFGAADPVTMRNLLVAIERQRLAAGLTNFTTTTEGTHWSGIPYGGAPSLIADYSRPVIDIEIGSTPESWADAVAVEVVARGLMEVFRPETTPGLRAVVCVGGIHMEPSYAASVFAAGERFPLAISHVLANQWLVSGGYESADGVTKLEACIASVIGGVQGLVYHDSLKGAVKAQVRHVAERLGIPVVSHRAIRRPETLPWW